jgi:hypothetical protein
MADVPVSIILHDNTRAHIADAVKDLRSWRWEILEHPPYSPDASMADVPVSIMTMQGLILLTLSRTSAAGDGRYWNIHHTHPI